MVEDSAAFRRYLEAKFDLDTASLNPRVTALFRQMLCACPSARVLDVGTGTGAVLRRLLELPLRGRTVLVGLDRDTACLAAARRALGRALRRQGWQVQTRAAALQGHRGERSLRIELAQGELLETRLPEPVAAGGFRAVTAQAVLDLLPLQPALRRLRPLLQPGGLLYASLNYDGLTTLLPPERPGGLEEHLLAEYDRSMERRRSDPGGLPTGGAFSGRRLYGAAVQEDYAVLAVGASDWCLFPCGGRYSETERQVLRAMLGFIAGEGLRNPRLPAQQVRSWLARRLAQMRRGRLALVVHQLDLLLAARD